MDDRLTVEAALVGRLIAEQFPAWSSLPITTVEPGGWDNRTFRLGEHLSVRLPSAERYVAQVDKEQRWLPLLAPHLPLPIPVPVGAGKPSAVYPWPWSVYPWLAGEPAARERISDLCEFATALARFLVALQHIDARRGPAPGPHNFFRGGSLSVYDAETRRAICELGSEIDGAAATALWDSALATAHDGAPVWVHGDMAAGNLLVQGGQLCAVIDFGSCGVGDPACDLSVAWTLLDHHARAAFRRALPLDAATWQRGRRWTLWKALITLNTHRDCAPEAEGARQVITALLSER